METSWQTQARSGTDPGFTSDLSNAKVWVFTETQSGEFGSFRKRAGYPSPCTSPIWPAGGPKAWYIRSWSSGLIRPLGSWMPRDRSLLTIVLVVILYAWESSLRVMNPLLAFVFFMAVKWCSSNSHRGSTVIWMVFPGRSSTLKKVMPIL